MTRVARPAAALVLLIAGLAGCAGRVLPCDGIPMRVHVDVTPGAVPVEFSEVADKLRQEARVGSCGEYMRDVPADRHVRITGAPVGPPPEPLEPSKTPDQVSDTSQVHVVGALDKRPHTGDAVLAQRKRTMVCTR